MLARYVESMFTARREALTYGDKQLEQIKNRSDLDVYTIIAVTQEIEYAREQEINKAYFFKERTSESLNSMRLLGCGKIEINRYATQLYEMYRL